MKKKEVKIILEQMKEIREQALKGIEKEDVAVKQLSLETILELLDGTTKVIANSLAPKEKVEKKKSSKTPTQFIKDRGLENDFKRFKMDVE